MENIKKLKLLMFLTLASCVIATTTQHYVNAASTANPQPVSAQIQTSQGIYVKPLTVVNSPSTYLNKSIILNAKFDKFSTLGLDYKPAMKSSEDYISFLIKRDDTGFNIPLSEMKLFLKRDVAEKFIDLRIILFFLEKFDISSKFSTSLVNLSD